MSKNIQQVFVANPITSNASTDLMYFGQSPYGNGNDAAMTYANFAAQFVLSSGILSPAHGGTGINNGTNTLTVSANSSINQNVTSTGSPTFMSTTVTTSIVAGNAIANNFAPATAVQVLVGGTVTLTNASAQIQQLGGSGGTIVLPDATTLVVGWTFFLHNNCSGNVVVQTNGGATLLTMVSGSFVEVIASTVATSAGVWLYTWSLPQNVIWGTAGLVSPTFITPILGTPQSGVLTNVTGLPLTSGVTGILPSANGGTGLASPTIHGVLVGEGSSPVTPIVLGAGQILIGTTSGDPTAAAINSGTGILVANGSGSITVSLSGSNGITAWIAASSTPITASVNTGYYITNASQTTITLPAVAAAGSIVSIVGNGAGGWILAPGAGQTIKVIGSSASTSITSSGQYDCIEVLCTVANTTWVARSLLSTGLTIV